jgi:hypothetical protein
MKINADAKLLIKIIKWVSKELRKDDHRYFDATGYIHLNNDGQVYDYIEHRENMKRSKGKTCNYKRKYDNRIQAEQALNSYRERVLFTSMNLYECEAHSCFHLGHDKYMSRSSILEGSMSA